MEINVGVSTPKVKLVSNHEYYKVAKSLISNSFTRCLCSLFIVDINPQRDKNLLVDDLLHELKIASIRGVNIKLMIGGSDGNLNIMEAALASTIRAKELGVPCALMASKKELISHMKLVIVDDTVLIGSHNWSGGAFTSQIQESLLVESEGLATYFSSIFFRFWDKLI